MFNTKFATDEKVQVLDEETGKWTKAEIVAITSSWSARIRWPDFPKIKNKEILIPTQLQNDRSEHLWCIRKWTNGKTGRRSRQEDLKAKELDN